MFHNGELAAGLESREQQRQIGQRHAFFLIELLSLQPQGPTEVDAADSIVKSALAHACLAQRQP